MQMSSWEEIINFPQNEIPWSSSCDNPGEITGDVKASQIEFLFCGGDFMVWIEGREIPEIERWVFEEGGEKRAIRSEFRVHEGAIMSKYRSQSLMIGHTP